MTAYRAACVADAEYSKAVRGTGARDRWSMTAAQAADPRVRAAYAAKLAADAAVLAAMRGRAPVDGDDDVSA